MISAPLKVAIVGKSPHSNEFAPWGDPSWEIWWIGSGAHLLPRWNRVFEIHDLDDGFKRWEAEYQVWLTQDHGKPVYVQKPDGRVPSGVQYPKDEIIARYGTYFNNSVSWAICLAMLEGASTIGVWGVDMADAGQTSNGEYQHQRPSCEYHLGYARGAGIDVYVHPNSSLLTCHHLYGFDLQACEKLRLLEQRKAHFREMAKAAKAEKEKAFAVEQQMLGGLNALELSQQWS